MTLKEWRDMDSYEREAYMSLCARKLVCDLEEGEVFLYKFTSDLIYRDEISLLFFKGGKLYIIENCQEISECIRDIPEYEIVTVLDMSEAKRPILNITDNIVIIVVMLSVIAFMFFVCLFYTIVYGTRGTIVGAIIFLAWFVIILRLSKDEFLL